MSLEKPISIFYLSSIKSEKSHVMQIEFNIVELNKNKVKISEKNLGFIEINPF